MLEGETIARTFHGKSKCVDGQADRKVTPCTFLPWVAADGRRTASDGREAAFGGRSADCQRRRKKKHLIEAAPFGHHHQMLYKDDRLVGGFGGALSFQPKTGGPGGQRPPAKIENAFLGFWKKMTKSIFSFLKPMFCPQPKQLKQEGLKLIWK